jgi:hypothetical protein
MDPNMTLFNNQIWALFREKVIYFGYYQRNLSTVVYVLLISVLFIFHYFFNKNYKKYHPLKIALLISLVALFSFPFLSHDFFNYIFDAKILTFYGKNPYLYKALDFPNDSWIRFMHWTHRSYPYGPIFLLITIIPSYLAMGKFIINFFLFKMIFIFFYVMAVFVLNKINKKWALFFATNPLVLIEGLFSPHNDLIAVSLAIIGLYYLFSKKNIWSRVLFLLSFGIKYMTVPVLFLTNKKKLLNKFLLIFTVLLIIYVAVKGEVQPWYFLNLLIFIPFFEKYIFKLNIFFFGLLLSYSPYVFTGDWKYLSVKHLIIYLFLAVDAGYIWLSNRPNRV